MADRFTADGFSEQPLFETVVPLEVTSFNPEETVELSLRYIAPDGQTFDLGLQGQDAAGAPVVQTRVRFQVPRDSGASLRLPVVAHASVQAQKFLLGNAVPIRDLGRSKAQLARFELALETISGGQAAAPVTTAFDLPLISQNSRVMQLDSSELNTFQVLRAGPTDLACLSVPSEKLDIDSGEIPVDGVVDIIAQQCDAARRHMLWREDPVTRQIISKVVDAQDNSYCLTAANKATASGRAGRDGTIFNPNNLRLERCAFHQNSPGNLFPPGTAIASQAFRFEGDRLNLEGTNVYVRVNGIGTPTMDVVLSAGVDNGTDIFTDANGSHVDSQGRLFRIARSFPLQIGDPDLASIDLEISGEAYLDYLPVIGTTAEGETRVSLSLFGFRQDLIRATAVHKRYMPRLTSVVSGNEFPVEVGNGAEASFELLGLEFGSAGSVDQSTISESFAVDETISNALGVDTGFGSFPGVDFADGDFNQELFSIRFVVFVVPVTIDGGVQGSYRFAVQPDDSLAGIRLVSTESLDLGGYLEAGIDALIAKATIVGEIDLISQKTDFSATALFVDRSTVLEGPRLGFDMQTALKSRLQMLKGDVSAKVEYWTLFGKKEKTLPLYSSAQLFSDNWTLFEENSALADFRL